MNLTTKQYQQLLDETNNEINQQHTQIYETKQQLEQLQQNYQKTTKYDQETYTTKHYTLTLNLNQTLQKHTNLTTLKTTIERILS